MTQYQKYYKKRVEFIEWPNGKAFIWYFTYNIEDSMDVWPDMDVERAKIWLRNHGMMDGMPPL